MFSKSWLCTSSPKNEWCEDTNYPSPNYHLYLMLTESQLAVKLQAPFLMYAGY